MNITVEQLIDIIAKHEKWVKKIDGGERAYLHGADLCRFDLRDADLHGADLCGANLCGADLCGVNLHGANLCDANLRGANLCGANLCGADLCGANLCGADLCGVTLRDANLCGADLCGVTLRDANLRGANLRGANLCDANLCGANLRDANLCGANLFGANLCDANLCDVDLHGANLYDANLYDAEIYVPMACPDTGTFTAWKRANNHIVKLQIPDTAKRSSATGRKCRCSEAIVLEIQNIDGTESELTEIKSDYDSNFIYKIGETVKVNDFCDDRFNECAPGIHFFINRQEAVNYSQR